MLFPLQIAMTMAVSVLQGGVDGNILAQLPEAWDAMDKGFSIVISAEEVDPGFHLPTGLEEETTYVESSLPPSSPT